MINIIEDKLQNYIDNCKKKNTKYYDTKDARLVMRQENLEKRHVCGLFDDKNKKFNIHNCNTGAFLKSQDIDAGSMCLYTNNKLDNSNNTKFMYFNNLNKTIKVIPKYTPYYNNNNEYGVFEFVLCDGENNQGYTITDPGFYGKKK